MTAAEPRWLGRLAIDAAHHLTIRDQGGVYGIRDEHLLESALARPRQRWAYDPDVGLPELAAAYLFGLVRNHPYVDGNKRVGLIAAVAFLARNRRRLTASEEEVATVVLDLAAGRISEPELAQWLTGRVVAEDAGRIGPPPR